MSVLRRLAFAVFPVAILLLTGCGIAPAPEPTSAMSPLSGNVHGGQQPVSGAAVQLYAVGTSADGSTSTPLLAAPILTDAGGGFSLTKYTCPSPFSLVYLTATGGNPGLSSGSSNPNLAMMTALGPCQNLSRLSFVTVNELTTVAAAYALATFTVSPFAVGSSPTDEPALESAFTLAGQYVNISSGTAPGSGIPAGFVAPVAQLDTLGDIVATCVNSLGGTAGDGSPCGTLFNLTNPGTPTLPATDTFTALTHLALNPTLNTAALYSLISPSAPFQPTQPTTPPDLNVYFTQPGPVLQFTPATITFAPISVTFTTPKQTVTLENIGTVPVTFTPPVISGANAADFAQTNTCVSPLAPGTACTIQLTATPAAIGPGTARLQIVSNAYSYPTITLAETGTALAAGALTFSPTHLSWTVANTLQDLTVSNNGSTPINLKSVTFSDPTFKLFSGTCGTQLPANSACTLVVESTGATLSSSTEATIYTGALTILTDAGTQAVMLTSNSQESTTPVVTFGSPAVGSSSIAVLGVQTIGSSYTASFSGSVFSGNTSDFSASGCSGSGYGSAAASCQFPITFTPTAPGPRTAKFGSLTTGYILLSGGSGAAAAGSLTLTSPPFIAPGATGVFTVTNTGTTPVSIGAASIGAYTFQGTQTFFQTNNCGTLLYGQSVCTVTVSASPGSFSSAALNVVTGSSSAPLSAPINLFPAPVPPSFITGDFGSYAVGTTSVSSNSVFGSTPNGPVTITLQGNAADFKAAAGACSYIRGACYYSATVNFVPTTLGLRSAFFTDASGTHTFSGFGLSPGPSFSLAAQGTTYPTNNISIGSINLGSSYTQSLNLANTGTTTLRLTQSITGPDASAFLVYPCNTLSYTANTPAATCSLSITATPTHLGTSTATLTVTDVSSGFSYAYNLSATATAPPVTVSPTSLSFPNTSVGSTSATQYVTFSDYYHGIISFSGSTSPAFSLVGPTTCTPAPCQLGFAFNPTAAGNVSGTFTFTDSTSGSVGVILYGTGIALPAVSLSPSSITFPARPVSSISTPTAIILTNTGGAPLVISSITLPGAVGGNFSQTSNCASSIAVNATCTINVSFAPIVAGIQSATLSIASNAANFPATVALSGSAN